MFTAAMQTVKYLAALLAVVSFCGASPSLSLLRPAKLTYTRTDDATGDTLVCEQCEPGFYLIRHCTKDRRSECGPCPSRHYTEIWNYIDKCLYCAHCTDNQYETVPCTSRTNRECACRNGFYMRYDSCYRHSRCPPGEGVVRAGTAHTDVTCAPCPEDQFSAQSSSTHTCQDFSVCAADVTAIPGDERHDVYCSKCKSDRTAPEDREECDSDLVEFIAKQSQSMTERKLRKFLTLLRREARSRHENLSTLELLKKIKSLCSSNNSQPFVMVMADILDRVGLHSLERKVNHFFS